MKGSDNPVGKADVMTMEEQACTRGHLTVEYSCLCGIAVVTEAFYRILLLLFVLSSFPSPLNCNRLGFNVPFNTEEQLKRMSTN